MALSTLNSKLENYIESIDVKTVSIERRKLLAPLIAFIQQNVNTNQHNRLHFICTHNSRRSHLTQVWAQTMAFYFKIKNIDAYSGGTESTAVFPLIIETLRNSGFEISAIANTENPIYSIKFANNAQPIIGFSKKLDATFNPKSEFAAIMTCSQADGGCPFISGASARIPITYDDPKAFDDTPLQSAKYQESSLLIATEMKYVFSQITTN